MIHYNFDYVHAKIMIIKKLLAIIRAIDPTYKVILLSNELLLHLY